MEDNKSPASEGNDGIVKLLLFFGLIVGSVLAFGGVDYILINIGRFMLVVTGSVWAFYMLELFTR